MCSHGPVGRTVKAHSFRVARAEFEYGIEASKTRIDRTLRSARSRGDPVATTYYTYLPPNISNLPLQIRVKEITGPRLVECKDGVRPEVKADEEANESRVRAIANSRSGDMTTKESITTWRVQERAGKSLLKRNQTEAIWHDTYES